MYVNGRVFKRPYGDSANWSNEAGSKKKCDVGSIMKSPVRFAGEPAYAPNDEPDVCDSFPELSSDN